MRIHRSHPDDHFTILPNATLRDDRLSYVARGILVELISRPDNWETNADALWRKAQNTRGEKTGEGRRAIRAALAELEEYGYLVRQKARAPRGRYITVVDLFDTPGHTAAEVPVNRPDRGTSIGTSVSEVSDSDNSETVALLRSNDHQRTDLRSTDHEHSSTFADAHVAAEKSAADDLEARRAKWYERVNRLSHKELSESLLALETRHPKIHGTCRDYAMKQYKRENPQILKVPVGVLAMDRMCLKYVVQHYSEGHYCNPDLPTWVERLLETSAECAERLRRTEQLAS